MRPIGPDDISSLDRTTQEALLDRLRFAARAKREFTYAVLMPLGVILLTVFAFILVGSVQGVAAAADRAMLDNLALLVAVVASGVIVWRGRRMIAAIRGFSTVSRTLRDAGYDVSGLHPLDIVRGLAADGDATEEREQPVLGLQGRRKAWWAVLKSQADAILVPAVLFALTGALVELVVGLPQVHVGGLRDVVSMVVAGGLVMALLPFVLTLWHYPRQSDVDREVARRRSRGEDTRVQDE